MSYNELVLTQKPLRACIASAKQKNLTPAAALTDQLDHFATSVLLPEGCARLYIPGLEASLW